MSEKKIKSNWKKIVTYVVYVLVLLFALAAISSKFSPKGLHFLTVQSGSMEPAIKIGSMVVSKSQQDYQEGGIITFYSASGTKDTTTHRIVEIVDIEEEVSFKTQGDANGAPDGNLVPKERVVGKVIFKIPYFGYPIAFSRTLPGLIILVIIPATIIIYDEISKIKNEIILKRKERKKAK